MRTIICIITLLGLAACEPVSPYAPETSIRPMPRPDVR